MQALINMLDMPMAPHRLAAAIVAVLHDVAVGSVDGCMLMLHGGIDMAAVMMLTSDGLHEAEQDAQMAAIIQQICQKVPQAQVRKECLIWLSGPPLINMTRFHDKRHRTQELCASLYMMRHAFCSVSTERW